MKLEDQAPLPDSVEAAALEKIYDFFDGRKHAFELLAARVAGEVLQGSGARYHAGWLTRSGGDGGVDFVGRLDVGMTTANTPLVVLGQAKCVKPSTSISPDQVARVVARLRRGWIGVYVTTGVFSTQAQAEVVDDQYPLLLIPGRVLAEQVLRMAVIDFDGDVDKLLVSIAGGYGEAITQRRPEEILFA
jgi:restriction endonuclease Mrr